MVQNRGLEGVWAPLWGAFVGFWAAFGRFLAPRSLLGDPWALLGRLLGGSRVIQGSKLEPSREAQEASKSIKTDA